MLNFARKRIRCTDKEIIEASETTMSAFEASRKLGINYKTYRTYAIRLNCFKTNQSGKGMDKKSIHKPGYEFNEHYFDDIDSNEKAYFLGFIAADGGVERQKGPLSFSLQKRDKEILIKFCECIGYDTSHVGEYTSGFLFFSILSCLSIIFFAVSSFRVKCIGLSCKYLSRIFLTYSFL